MPKFRPHRESARRVSQRKTTLDEVAEESPHTSAADEDHGVELKKRASMPVGRTADKDDKEKSPDECVVLLSNEQPSTSAEPEDGNGIMPQRRSSQAGRGKLQRQDVSIL